MAREYVGGLDVSQLRWVYRREENPDGSTEYTAWVYLPSGIRVEKSICVSELARRTATIPMDHAFFERECRAGVIAHLRVADRG